jgi:putative iron-only hydrogenase system regulator
VTSGENRIGGLIILISDEGDIQRINAVISDYSDIILGRQGIPLRDRSINVISLLMEGNTDLMGALAGKLGRMNGVKVKSVLAG